MPAMAQRRDRQTDPLRDATRGVRLQKAMADAGVGSRRRCEELIEEGRVRVNGRFVRELPAWVDPTEDEIIVEGRPLRKPGRPMYVMLYKPRGVVGTLADPAGRRTIADLVKHPAAGRLFPVGRLEYDASGLVLLTNDGELTRRLTHARFGIEKVYWATVKGDVAPDALPALEQAIARAKPKPRADAPRKKKTVTKKRRTRQARVKLAIVGREGGKTVLSLTFPEGRNREAAWALGEAGHPVRKLVQVSLGPLRLSAVRMGEWRELKRDEVRALRAAVFPKGRAGAAQ